jgi:spermidine synthase
MTIIKKYRSKFRLNKIIHRIRTIAHKPIIIAETESPLSGKIQIVDIGSERLLKINGFTHSFVNRNGNYNEIGREYWGQISKLPFKISHKPDVLMLGLGGGSALKMLAHLYKPNSITVVEHDPVIIDLAKKYFELDMKNIDVINISANKVFEPLNKINKKYDLIIDDVYNDESQKSFAEQLEFIKRLILNLMPNGVLVLNKAINSSSELNGVNNFCKEIQKLGLKTFVRTVRQRFWNILIYCRIKNNLDLEESKC